MKESDALGDRDDGENRVARMRGGQGSLASIVSEPIIHVGLIKTEYLIEVNKIFKTVLKVLYLSKVLHYMHKVNINIIFIFTECILTHHHRKYDGCYC